MEQLQATNYILSQRKEFSCHGKQLQSFSNFLGFHWQDTESQAYSPIMCHRKDQEMVAFSHIRLSERKGHSERKGGGHKEGAHKELGRKSVRTRKSR